MDYNFSLILIRLKKCVIKSSILSFPQYNFLLNSISLIKYMIELLIVFLLYLIRFLFLSYQNVPLIFSLINSACS